MTADMKFGSSSDRAIAWVEWCGRFRGAVEMLLENPSSGVVRGHVQEMLDAYEEWKSAALDLESESKS